MRGLTGEAREQIVKKLKATLISKRIKGLFQAVVFIQKLEPYARKIQRKRRLLAVFVWSSRAVAIFKRVLARRRERIRQENLKRNLAV